MNKTRIRAIEKKVKPKDNVYIAIYGNDGAIRIEGNEISEEEFQQLAGTVIRVKEDGFGAL